MYRNILAPQDGSPVAEATLPCITHLARNLGARLTLLTVLEPPSRPAAGRRAETETQAEALAHLRRLASRCRDAGTEAQTLVAVGRPAAEIVRQAQAGPFDLIALGTRGHTGLRRGLLGSVTDEVVRTAQAPVLVLSPAAMERFGQGHHHPAGITVPLDGSELAERALPHAEALAKTLNVELRLLRVVSVASLAYYGGEGQPVDAGAIEESLAAEAQEYLNGVLKRVQDAGVKATATVSRGPVALMIADELRRTPDHLAAICTHGRSGLGRVLIGSVADYLIRSSGVPVLVVNPSGAA
ncbi:MAG: universal stress protein [SAR202 cluster bacterium]|nr:universal stress protein [SAR202 cluster bacterium]